jgi:hypothetical protein
MVPHKLHLGKVKYDLIVSLGSVVTWFCSKCKKDRAEGFKPLGDDESCVIPMSVVAMF